MDADSGTSRERRTQQAEAYYRKGLELKSSKLPDRALTEFRRAVLSDPEHAQSHYEIGLLCKSRASTDPFFWRYAFEAFRSAARLDLNNQQAHDQYIMVGQKMGCLDQLHSEYDKLAKANPENALFQRCAKNIVTLSLALIPEQVNVGGSDHGKLRKMLLLTSIGLILFGLALAIGPMISSKFSKQKLDPRTMKRGVILGMIAMAAGVGGFFARGRLGRE